MPDIPSQDESGHNEIIVLSSHGTALACFLAALDRRPPDLNQWRSIPMPDLRTVWPEQLAPLIHDADPERWRSPV